MEQNDRAQSAEEIVRGLRRMAPQFELPGQDLLQSAGGLIETQAAEIAELNDFASSQRAKLLARVAELERQLAGAGANQLIQAHIIECQHNPLDADKIVRLTMDNANLRAQLSASQQRERAAVEAVNRMAEYIVTKGRVDYWLCDDIPEELHLKHQPKNDGNYDNAPCIKCVAEYFMGGPQEAEEGAAQ